MKKRILSLILTFTLIASLANVVMAAGESDSTVSSPLEMKYPATDITPEFAEGFGSGRNYALASNPTGNTSATEIQPVDNDRVFTVKTNNGTTKSFLLLDKDNEGNYFVVEEKPTTRDWRYYGMSDAGYVHDSTSNGANAWKFDTTVSSPYQSIANYLNNFTSGYARDNADFFPQKIKPYLVERNWTVGADPAVDYTGENATWSETKRANNPAYTTRGKLALLSAQEYIAYKDILGYTNRSSLGTALRTPASCVYESSGATTYVSAPMVISATTDNVCLAYGVTPTRSNTNVQVCFWVNAEFFKNVKVE